MHKRCCRDIDSYVVRPSGIVRPCSLASTSASVSDLQPSWSADDAFAAGKAFVASMSKAMVFMRSLRGVRFLQRTDGDTKPTLVLEVRRLSSRLHNEIVAAIHRWTWHLRTKTANEAPEAL